MKIERDNAGKSPGILSSECQNFKRHEIIGTAILREE